MSTSFNKLSHESIQFYINCLETNYNKHDPSHYNALYYLDIYYNKKVISKEHIDIITEFTSTILCVNKKSIIIGTNIFDLFLRKFEPKISNRLEILTINVLIKIIQKIKEQERKILTFERDIVDNYISKLNDFYAEYKLNKSDPRFYNAIFSLNKYYKTNIIPRSHIIKFDEIKEDVLNDLFKQWLDINNNCEESTFENFIKYTPLIKKEDNTMENIDLLITNEFLNIIKEIKYQNDTI